MNKAEWQALHGLADDEMEDVCAVMKEVNGIITQVSGVPRNSKGEVVPFIKREGYQGVKMWEMFARLPRKGGRK